MNDVIVGNICAFGAMLCDSFSGTRRTKKSILLVQCVSQFFYVACSLVLKGYSATVQNAIAVFRNLMAAYEKKNKAIEIILIVLPVILGLWVNNRGLMGVIPVVANLEYSIAVFAFTDSPTKLKYAFIINIVMFTIFNFAIQNYVSTIAGIVSCITTMVSVISEKKKKYPDLTDGENK